MKKIIPILILITSLFAQQTRVNELKAEKVLCKRIDSPIVYIGSNKAFYADGDVVKTASSFLFEGDVTYNGNMDVEGYLTGRKCGTYAFLSERDTTEIVKADSLHFVQGVFINSPIEDFKIANFQLVYSGIKTQFFEIIMFATLSSSVNNTEVHITIVNDDSTYTPQRQGNFLKNANQPYQIGGNLVLELMQNDTIRIKAEADNICDLDFRHFTTSIKEFFD